MFFLVFCEVFESRSVATARLRNERSVNVVGELRYSVVCARSGEDMARDLMSIDDVFVDDGDEGTHLLDVMEANEGSRWLGRVDSLKIFA